MSHQEFLFFDSFVGNRHLADASMLRPVVGIISVDNYDDITDDLSDADTSKINSFVANFIDEFMESKRIFTVVLIWIATISLQTLKH